jgi:ketosteroid isomerase-like protein
MIGRLVVVCLLGVGISSSSNIIAQKLPGPVQEVVDAEIAFARLSKEKSTREAFLENLAVDAIVFSNGEPVNGIDLWKKRPASNGMLYWWPVFADVSLSEDFGYTTGPYEMSKDKGSDPFAFGYYATVWKKNGSGDWKVAADLGINFEAPEEDRQSLKTVRRSSAKGKKPLPSSKEDLTFIEQSYTQWLNETGNSFLPEYFSRECRIHRSGNWPYTSMKVIESIQEERQFYFEPVDADVSESGDLGYTYGKVKIESKDGNMEKANYLRVWKREAGLNWKIVLDVIGS